MKKILSIAIIAIVIIVFGGCSKKNNEANQSDQPVSVIETKEAEKNDGLLGGVMDDLTKIKNGESMKCVYTIKIGEKEFKSESYVQGDKFKSITAMDAGEEMKTYAIFDGENQYSWTEGQTEGFKMSMDCADSIEGDLDENAKEDSEESGDVMEIDDMFENAIDMDCQPVDKIDFTIPSNITFVDQCEMLKNQMKQLEELGGALPEGFEIPMEMD